MFERARKNDGSTIPRRAAAATPAIRRRSTPTASIHDVGTKFAYDRDGKFDAPHLLNIYDSAPYLHNGIAQTLEEIWTSVQSLRRARRDQRHDQGPVERFDRVSEDALDRPTGKERPMRQLHIFNFQLSQFLIAFPCCCSACPSPCAPPATSCRSNPTPACPTSIRMGAVHHQGWPAQRPHLRRQGRRAATASGSAPRTAWPATTRRRGKIRSWSEKDGLPWRVVTAIEVDPKTGDVWLGLFGGGLARFSGGRFDHFHQLNSGLVNDVVYAVAVENDNVWCATTAGASRYNTKNGQVGHLHREERAHGGDLELQRLRQRRQGVPGRLGQRRARVRRRRPRTGRPTSIPTARWKSTSTATTASSTSSPPA